MENWKDVFHVVKRGTLIPQAKPWSFLKDMFWPNCRKTSSASVGKVKTAKPQNTKDTNIMNCDDEVFAIVGHKLLESDASHVPVLKLVSEQSTHSLSPIDSDHELCLGLSSAANPTKISPYSLPTTVKNQGNSNQQAQKKHRNGKRKVIQKESIEIRQKRKLMVKHLQLLNHKLRLEIALLEKQLGLPPSIHTRQMNEIDDTQRNHGSG